MAEYYEFKGATAEVAIGEGLEELGLTEDDVKIEVVKEGGIFSKAIVRITPNEPEPAEESSADAIESEPGATGAEDASEPEGEAREEKIARLNGMRDAGREFVASVARAIGAEATVDAKVRDGEILIFVGGADAKKFIGYKGEVLDAIQILASQCANRGNPGERVRVTVDADFYRERRKRSLAGLAKRVAKQAHDTREEIALEPMNSYERRIIHTALANSDEAESHSEGEGKDRHVVITPLNAPMVYGNVSAEFRKKGPGKTRSYGKNKTFFK